MELVDGERLREGAPTWNRRGSLESPISSSYVLLAFRMFFWSMVGEGIWTQHGLWRKAVFCFAVARLGRAGCAKLRPTWFLCRALEKPPAVSAVVSGIGLEGLEQCFWREFSSPVLGRARRGLASFDPGNESLGRLWSRGRRNLVPPSFLAVTNPKLIRRALESFWPGGFNPD
jgi:hypothetical protein